MNTDLQAALTQALLSHEKVWADEEKTILAKNILLDLVEKTDPTIIGLLLGNDDLKRHFFVEVNGVLVFKLQDFRFFLDKHSVNNSYTKYANRIGLTDGNRFLKDSSDIVLDFPFKDCVLNGGQSTEEGEEIYFKRNNDQSDSQLYTKLTRKRQEIFFNQTLAFDEIDRLFDAKAFSKFSRYTADGKQAVGEIKRHADGTIAENLIIKGNNLIALHSLAKQFKGKVKLIYIDPPYNTGNDGFKYNDKFNHSTWLTFMKNRLEIAKTLLADDGVIFVQCDDNEQAYLKVLMDDIFGRDCFIANFIWKKKGTSTNVEGVQVSQLCDFILAYSKTKRSVIKPRMKNSSDRSYPLSDSEGNFRLVVIEKKNTGEYQRDTMQFNILDTPPRDGKRWQIGEVKARELEAKNRFTLGDDGVVRLKIYSFEDGDSFSAQPTLLIDNMGSTNDGNKQLSSILSENNFNNPKPEELMHHLIKITTNENDIVLDYHLGSGTTCAVAHKMGRRWIGIEQMDYIEDITKARLLKVLEGEQGGISKSLDWQGGGSFVYFELKKYNQDFLNQIMAANSKGELDEVYADMAKNAFLKFWFDKNEFEKDENFRSLDLDQRKELLISILDENQLYLNHADMRDSRYHVSEEEMNLTDLFYGAKND